MKFAGAILTFLLFCTTALANDVSLGPNHKMGIVVYNSPQFSLILTTKHGGTEKTFRKYDSKNFDASILVAKPLTPSVIRNTPLDYEKLYHWNLPGYPTNFLEVLFEDKVVTNHACWPGHSGSGVYDKDGNVVGMCIAFTRQTEQDKRGNMVFLKVTSLKRFIDDVIKLENERYYGKR